MKKEKFKKKIEEISDEEIRKQQEAVKKQKMPKIRVMDFLYEGGEIVYEYPELIALCPMTGIPDFYTVKIFILR